MSQDLGIHCKEVLWKDEMVESRMPALQSIEFGDNGSMKTGGRRVWIAPWEQERARRGNRGAGLMPAAGWTFPLLLLLLYRKDKALVMHGPYHVRSMIDDGRVKLIRGHLVRSLRLGWRRRIGIWRPRLDVGQLEATVLFSWGE